MGVEPTQEEAQEGMEQPPAFEQEQDSVQDPFDFGEGLSTPPVQDDFLRGGVDAPLGQGDFLGGGEDAPLGQDDFLGGGHMSQVPTLI